MVLKKHKVYSLKAFSLNLNKYCMRLCAHCYFCGYDGIKSMPFPSVKVPALTLEKSVIHQIAGPKYRMTKIAITTPIRIFLQKPETFHFVFSLPNARKGIEFAQRQNAKHVQKTKRIGTGMRKKRKWATIPGNIFSPFHLFSSLNLGQMMMAQGNDPLHRL